MKLLLDTCAILWLASDRGQFSAKARSAMAENGDRLFVSAISALEISLKQRKRKLILEEDASRWWASFVMKNGVTVMSVSDSIAIASTKLPFIHHDPSDRIIIATAMLSDMSIITSDRVIRQYPEASVIW